MAVLNLKSFELSATDGLMGSVRSWLQKWQSEPEVDPALPVAPVAAQPTSQDQARYASLLENELDRQLLSEVEREDSEMLARVRDALYADD